MRRLCLLTALVLAGCAPPAEVVAPDQLRALVAGSTAIVVVYSRTGHTAQAGRALADELRADYVRLQGAGTEGDSWLSTPSWTDPVKLSPAHVELGPYRLVLVGGPVWYWKPNALTWSFLETHDLTGKDVVLFFTFEGGAPSEKTLAAWKAQVARRGGALKDVVGIDRSKLGPGVSVADEARRIALGRKADWTRQAPPR